MAEEGGVGSLAIDRGLFTAAEGEVEAGGRIKEEPKERERDGIKRELEGSFVEFVLASTTSVRVVLDRLLKCSSS